MRTVKEFKKMMSQNGGDSLNIAGDSETLMSLIDASLIRYFRGDKAALQEWAELVLLEADKEHYDVQTINRYDAHKYLLELLTNFDIL